MLVRQLEEEVVKTRAHAKETNPEIKAHIESLQIENDALTREVAILKETTKVRESFGQSCHIRFMDAVWCLFEELTLVEKKLFIDVTHCDHLYSTKRY